MLLPAHNQSQLFDLYQKHSLFLKVVCIVAVDVLFR